jgi:hypothetical protein
MDAPLSGVRQHQTAAVVIASERLSMRTRLRNRVRFSLILALVATLVTWLVLGENSPLEGYFLYHVAVPNLFRKILTLPYLILIILRPRLWVDEIGYLLVFLEWLVGSFVLSLLIYRSSAAE